MKIKIRKKDQILYIIFNLIAAILNLLTIYLLGVMINRVTDGVTATELIKVGMLTLGTGLSASVFKTVVSDYITIYKVNIEQSERISYMMLNKVLLMPPKHYNSKMKSFYYNVVSNSSFTYAGLLAQYQLELTSSVLLVLMILMIVFLINQVVFLVFIGIIPIIVLVSRYQSKGLADMQKDVIEKQDEFISDLKNIVEHKREINILNQNEYFLKRYKNAISNWGKYIKKFRFYELLVESLPTIIYSVYNILYLVIGGMLVMDGAFSLGLLITGYQLLGYFSQPISRICNIAIRLNSNKEHIKRVDEINELKVDNEAYYDKISKRDEFLLLDNFSLFTDSNNETQLFNVENLKIDKNSFVIVKGDNGSGKSMLMNYITGNIDMSFGSGGCYIDLSVKKSAYLTYPTIFTNGMMHENMFNIEVDSRVETFLNIDFTNKIIKTNPINLSLGQQQKMALLRVLSMESEVLILDEPMSNLDTGVQKQLVKYLSTIKNTKTIFVIMHDDSLDHLADQTITIIDGNIFCASL